MLKFIIISSIFLLTPAFAYKASDKNRLDEMEAEFAKLDTSTDIDTRINSALQIYRFSPRVYGKKSIEYANIVYTLATLYEEKGIKGGRENNKALDLYEDYFKILDKAEKEINEEYFKKYIEYVHFEQVIKGYSSKNTHFETALTLANHINYSPEKIADLKIDYSLKILFSNKVSAAKYMNSARKEYELIYDKTHYKYAEILILSGIVEQQNGNRTLASNQYNQAIEILDKYDQKNLKLKDQTHRYLVEFYEKLNRSDEATYHCQALAKNYSLLSIEDIQPIYSVLPKFPRTSPEEKSITEWSAVLEFAIDTNGRTKNIRVVESSNSIYDNVVIEAVSKFRYAPEIINGQLIEKEGVRIPIHQFWIKRG